MRCHKMPRDAWRCLETKLRFITYELLPTDLPVLIYDIDIDPPAQVHHELKLDAEAVQNHPIPVVVGTVVGGASWTTTPANQEISR